MLGVDNVDPLAPKAARRRIKKRLLRSTLDDQTPGVPGTIFFLFVGTCTLITFAVITGTILYSLIPK